MRKFLYITTNLNDSGGVSRILSVKLNYLVQEFGYQIHIINTTGNSNSMFYHFEETIQITSLNTNKMGILTILSYKKALNNAIYAINPDIIVNCDNGLKGSLLPYLITSKVPLIYERHCSKNIVIGGLFEKIKLKVSNFILNSSTNAYNTFIVLNAEEKQDWKYKNVQVIPNSLWYELPIETVDFTKKVAIAVGRQSFEKGYDKLLKIWEIVIKKHPYWMLKIYGEKNVNLQLEAIASKLNIVNNVEFCSPVRNIQNVYLNASMLLNTSSSEAFGLSIIEGMSFGLPVIAFKNTSGARSIITNNENGFLINKGSLNVYADTVIKLIENKNEVRRISANAKESAKKYDLNTIMKLWHNLFQSLK